MRRTTRSVEETEALAAEVVAMLSHPTGQAGSATILTLSGDLGAGKTAFTKGIAKALNIPETVTSPTFVIEKIYYIEPEAGVVFTRLIHIDAYRLESGAELEAIGWYEIATDPQNLIVIEWPERVQEIVPHRAHTIEIAAIDETVREFAIDE